MGPSTSQKRKIEAGIKGKPSRPSKRVRKQQNYDSASSSPSVDEFNPVDLDSDVPLASPPAKTSPSPFASSSSSASDSNSASDSESGVSSTHSQPRLTTRHKRNDPTAFSNSISKILSTKLPTSARADPLLSRSKDAHLASQSLSNSRLETKARQKLREEKKLDLQRGRVKDVLLGDGGGGGAGEIAELERRLRKTAQRGVVKLFNAVRGAQVRGEEAASNGGVGKRKEERVGDMSKKGFLELVAGRGSKGKGVAEA